MRNRAPRPIFNLLTQRWISHQLKRTKKVKGCLLFQGTLSRGYAQAGLCGILNQVYVARAILSWKLGRDLLSDLETCHSCINRNCINVSHLSEGTRSKNNGSDKARDGTDAIGQNNGNSKLSIEEIQCVKRHLILKNLKQCRIAKIFGVRPSTITRYTK